MHSSYINSNTNGDTSRSTVNQQRLTSFGHYNHEIIPNLNTAHDMQFAMNNSSYHYNKSFLTGDGSTGDCFNSHKVILEKKGKRSSNKDRHSKINTARGPRDRRMRLSITVAKEFFRLQDLLGFDKCSTTIEWLLMKSKPAICDLQLQSSGNSECEVTMSGIAADEEKLINSCSGDYKKERRKLDQFVAKKTRKEARARARKRAAEKRNIKLQEYSKDRSIRALDHQVMDGNRRQLGPWIQFVERQGDQLEYPSPDSHFKQLGIDGDDSTCIMSSSWSPSLLFSYQHSLGTSHEHELSDFQNKPWESINN